MKVRIEKDDLGEKEVPIEAYYGIQTLRSMENFDIAKRPISRQMIKGLAVVKKAAAKANYECGYLNDEVYNVISLTCDEIFNGRLHGQFITDLVQGGGGTSMNMNANEVIANRANEMLGKPKGSYNPIHPIDQVNLCQSTNDVVPTAGKFAAIVLTKKLLVEMKKFANAYEELAKKYDSVITTAKTHLNDSVPVTYGKLFSATQYSIEKDMKRITQAMQGMLEVNLGGTIIGTGYNADPKYVRRVVRYLSEFSGEDFYQSKNMIDCTRGLDSFVWLSTTIKTFALDLQKIANDLKLNACCFNTVKLPEVQSGSSFTPGKVTPVVLEMVAQVVYYIEGNDLTICRCAAAGEMEFNVNIPIVLACLFENLNFIRRTIRVLREKCLEGLEVIGLQDNEIYANFIITSLQSKLGYDKTREIIQEARRTNRKTTDILLERKLISKEEIEIFKANADFAKPGFIKFQDK